MKFLRYESGGVYSNITLTLTFYGKILFWTRLFFNKENGRIY